MKSITKFKTFALLAIACVGLLALSACTTTKSIVTLPDGTTQTNVTKVLDITRVSLVANQAAIDGTAYVLGTHPEWRPQFQQAEDDLNLLASSPSVSLSDILAIAQRLPVKELGSSTAKISFEGATLGIALLDIPQLSPTANADIQSLAKAIASGIATGISNAPPVPIKPPSPAPVVAPTAAAAGN